MASFIDRIITRFSQSEIESESGESPDKSRSGWLQTTLALVISVAFISYFLRGLDWQKVWEASKDADIGIAILTTTVSWFIGWIVFTWQDQLALRWFHGPFPFLDFLWLRGAVHLLQLIHPSLRAGVLLVYQKKKAAISWEKLIGIKLLMFGTGLWAYSLFQIPITAVYHTLGLHQNLPYSPDLIYLFWFLLLVPGLIWFLLTLRFFWFKLDFLGIGKFIVRERHHVFWSSFWNAKPRHWLILMSMIIALFIIHIVAVYIRNIAFGVEVPMIVLMATLVWASVVAGLPISYSGFGTTTLAWMLFYGDYGSKEQIVALTLFAPTMGIVLKLAFGVLTLKPGLSALGKINMVLKS